VRRAVLRLSLVVLLAGSTLVLTAPPCAACSCAPQSPKQLFGGADAAFVGSVVDQEAIDQTTTVQTFAVRSVFKGRLGETVHVIAPIGSGGGDTCGVLFGAGEVAVILHRLGDGWTTDVCSRITVAQLTAVGPTPVHPSPEPSGPPTSIGPPPGSDQGSGGLGWPAAVIGLLLGVAAIAAAFSLGGRRDRDRASPLADPDAAREGSADPPGPSD
jgi:hypothetical protein